MLAVTRGVAVSQCATVGGGRSRPCAVWLPTPGVPPRPFMRGGHRRPAERPVVPVMATPAWAALMMYISGQWMLANAGVTLSTVSVREVLLVRR